MFGLKWNKIRSNVIKRIQLQLQWNYAGFFYVKLHAKLSQRHRENREERKVGERGGRGWLSLAAVTKASWESFAVAAAAQLSSSSLRSSVCLFRPLETSSAHSSGSGAKSGAGVGCTPHSSYEYYSICTPKCRVMSCTSVPRWVASAEQEKRTSLPSPHPLCCIIIIVLQHLPCTCVRFMCQMSRARPTIPLKLNQARKSNQPANCFASFFTQIIP